MPSCALRVVADEPQSARLELRTPGADVNPHLCAAMLLGAAYGELNKTWKLRHKSRHLTTAAAR